MNRIKLCYTYGVLCGLGAALFWRTYNAARNGPIPPRGVRPAVGRKTITRVDKPADLLECAVATRFACRVGRSFWAYVGLSPEKD
ncbi:MAG: hypothetical protein WA140_00025 [Geobacteraceae bacterium]